MVTNQTIQTMQRDLIVQGTISLLSSRNCDVSFWLNKYKQEKKITIEALLGPHVQMLPATLDPFATSILAQYGIRPDSSLRNVVFEVLFQASLSSVNRCVFRKIFSYLAKK